MGTSLKEQGVPRGTSRNRLMVGPGSPLPAHVFLMTGSGALRLLTTEILTPVSHARLITPSRTLVKENDFPTRPSFFMVILL